MKLSAFDRKFELSNKVAVVVIIVAALVIGYTGFIISMGNKPIITVGDSRKSTGTSSGSGVFDTLSGKTFKIALSGVSAIRWEAGAKAGGEITTGGTAANSSPGVETDSQKIYIYVVGCVMQPGVVCIDRGMMVRDAVEAAGGLSPDADSENVNLVYKLYDNAMLRIKPVYTEVYGLYSGSDGSGSEGYTGNGLEIISDSTGAVLGEAAGYTQAGNDAGDELIPVSSRININKATAGELDSLPGIGPATAASIIEYREKTGGFGRIEDIMLVAGIKDAKFGKIKDYIVAE